LYVWDRLAETQGWLVFEPNYRGSTGYGDKFPDGLVPELVSRPGKDILQGVDALVKEALPTTAPGGGGYSYGGYMTRLADPPNHALQGCGHRRWRREHVANGGTTI